MLFHCAVFHTLKKRCRSQISQSRFHSFAGTLHKWFFVPRGCALLRVAQRFQESTRPVVTSHCYNQKPWQMDFFYQATRDSTTYMVVKDAVKFYEDLGGLVGRHPSSHTLLWFFEGCYIDRRYFSLLILHIQNIYDISRKTLPKL